MFDTYYTKLQNRKRDDFVYHSDLPSKTIQEPKAYTDINNIVDLYCRNGRAGELLTVMPADYVDNTLLPNDYQEAMDLIMEVNENFENLPSHIRKELGNTPLGMLQWISDPANTERGIELGILEKVGSQAKFEPSEPVSPASPAVEPTTPVEA